MAVHTSHILGSAATSGRAWALADVQCDSTLCEEGSPHWALATLSQRAPAGAPGPLRSPFSETLLLQASSLLQSSGLCSASPGREAFSDHPAQRAKVFLTISANFHSFACCLSPSDYSIR